MVTKKHLDGIEVRPQLRPQEAKLTLREPPGKHTGSQKASCACRSKLRGGSFRFCPRVTTPQSPKIDAAHPRYVIVTKESTWTSSCLPQDNP